MMRKLIVLVLILALMVPAGQAFSADTTKTVQVSFAPIHYVIDGTDYAPPADQLGFIYEGSTYVPLRFVGNILSRTVAWDGANAKVTIAAPTSEDWKNIRAYLSAQAVKDSSIVPVDKSAMTQTAIKINTTEVSYEFDGQLVQPNAATPGFMYENRIFVPLRFMYESLGFNPSFDSSTYAITTTTDAEQLAYQIIVKTHDVLIVEKKAACEADLLALGLQFLAKQKTVTAEETEAFYQEALVMLNDCRAELDAMLATLTTELTDAGYPTDVVDQYRAAIVAREEWGRNLVESYR